MNRGEIKPERVGGAVRVVALAVLVVACAPSISQTTVLSPAGSAHVDLRIRRVPDQQIIFREIVDPYSRARWVLLRDAAHPEGPGRLVPAKPGDDLHAPADRGEMSELTPSVVAPCIHVGDRVVVREHTAAAEVTLEAVAMEPAATGSLFHVRLRVGGKVVRAVAVAPGRAELARAVEAER